MELFATISDNLFAVSAWATVAYTVGLVIYRLWLCPVAHFPGSPWCKITFLYEFYWEWIRPGQYYRRIQEMHEKYGESVFYPSLLGEDVD